MLYTGANYPLLYRRMGKGEKAWGKKGEGKKANTCGRWLIFKKQFWVLSLFHRWPLYTLMHKKLWGNPEPRSPSKKVLSQFYFCFFFLQMGHNQHAMVGGSVGPDCAVGREKFWNMCMGKRMEILVDNKHSEGYPEGNKESVSGYLPSRSYLN